VLIEIVCHANVCRSPVGAAFLRARAPQGVEVRSSGLFAEAGVPADPTMVARLGARFPDLITHSAQRTTMSALAEADLVLVMERSQRSHIAAIAPHLAGRTMLFGAWRGTVQDIADPIGLEMRAYDIALNALEASAETWCQKLLRFA
jgi:protein-tyrosine phosphatase